MLQKIADFLNIEIWRIRARDLPKQKGFFIRTLRVVILSLKEFARDNCALRASALTFFSLLSVVPIFAMAFGVAKGFGVERMLEEKILESLSTQETVVTRIIDFARSMLESTSGGLVAGIGIAVLFWTVIKMLGNIELAFNKIWGVRQSRALGRKFSDYLSLMLICPLAIILSSSLNVFISSQVSALASGNSIINLMGPVLFFLVQLIPYCVLWGLLTFLYVFMPNTRVKISSAFLGGVVAGTGFQITQFAYIHSQLWASKYGAIYGSFAALPLFLIWLQISWLIVLFGAEVAFAHQNEETFEFEPDAAKASPHVKTLVALRIVKLICEVFQAGKAALSGEAIAERLRSPIRLTREMLSHLRVSGVICEVKGPEEKLGYFQPAHPVETLTVKNVLDALNHNGESKLPFNEDADVQMIKALLTQLDRDIASSSGNATLLGETPLLKV